HLADDPPAAADPLEDELLEQPGRRALRVEPRRDAHRCRRPVLAPGDLDLEVLRAERVPEVHPGRPVDHRTALAIDLTQQVLTALNSPPGTCAEQTTPV